MRDGDSLRERRQLLVALNVGTRVRPHGSGGQDCIVRQKKSMFLMSQLCGLHVGFWAAR